MEGEEKTSYKILQPLLLAAAMSIGMMMGYKMNDRPDQNLISLYDMPKDSIKMTGRVEELIRFIRSKYVQELSADSLVDVAVKAIFDQLDPHSSYLSPAEVSDVHDQMHGSYNGMGIENYLINDTIHISAVLDESPAEKAGLKVFDKIISVDGSKIAGSKLPYQKIRTMLRKNPGEVVSLQIRRGQEDVTIPVKIAEIQVKTVSATFIPDIHTCLVKIDRFGSNTYKEFMEAIEFHFEKNGAKHLILDLRDNPGGYLPEATNILCQIFEEKEKLLLFTQGRDQKKNEYKSNGKRFFDIDKVVVLIDENSASASEIVAGAIQDWDRGIIVGRRSYGKGLVQEQYDLNNGGAIRLTVAKYYTPSGRSIQRDYSDRSLYDDDFEDRYIHGDLFFKDSSLVKNGGKYYTLNLKRKVSGSGGITPDVFVSMDTIYKNEASFHIKSLIPEFTFKYVSQEKSSLPKEAALFTHWTLPKKVLHDFYKHVVASDSAYSKFVEKDIQKFENDIKASIKKYAVIPGENMSLTDSGDIFIKTAVKLIKENRQVKDL